MAKRQKRQAKAGGPYLAAAFFCEGITEDKQDGAISVFRMIDQINVAISADAPADYPSDKERLPIPISALLSFKTADAPGDHTLRLVMQSPSGRFAHENAHEQTLTFTPQPHGGFNLRLQSVVAVNRGGLFWLHVFLDGKRFTRMPLQISITRVPVTSPESPAPGANGANPPT